MFLVNKSDNEEVIELIYSGTGFCIVVDQIDTLEAGNPIGRIIRTGKKVLKKNYKKLKLGHRLILINSTTEDQKDKIIETFETDKIGILQYTEEYIDKSKYLDRIEETKNQSEADRRRMMKELADDYNPNGISVSQ